MADNSKYYWCFIILATSVYNVYLGWMPGNYWGECENIYVGWTGLCYSFCRRTTCLQDWMWNTLKNVFVTELFFLCQCPSPQLILEPNLALKKALIQCERRFLRKSVPIRTKHGHLWNHFSKLRLYQNPHIPWLYKHTIFTEATAYIPFCWRELDFRRRIFRSQQLTDFMDVYI